MPDEPTPTPVQAFVVKDVARPQPRREYSTRRESSATRLERRRRILDLFFVAKAGTRRDHEQAAYALINEVLDDDERERLRGFVRRLVGVCQSIEP